MKFLILGDSYQSGAPNYRGTDRNRIQFADEFDESHPVNRLFFTFLEKQDNYGLLEENGLELADEVIRMYQKFINIEFQIIRVTHGKEEPIIDHNFLGYDISSGVNLSYLSNGLDYCDTYSHDLHFLMCLLENHFKPKLNRHGLFDEYEMAEMFLGCVKEINKLKPNFWDDPDTYEILGLSTVG